MTMNFTFFKHFYRASLALALVFTASASAQDSCAAPQVVTAGTHVVAAINGTNITTSCSNASMAEWFAYTPTQNYLVTVTSDLPANLCKDTNVSIYTGTCAQGSLFCVAEDDDSGVLTCNSGNSNSYLSKATFAVTAGVTYYIVWDNQWNASGFTWQLSEIVSPCANTTTVTAGITTVNAIDQANIATSCSSATLAKWYKYTPTANYRVTITSDLPQNICKDTNFSVYTGSCPTLNCVTSDDNSGTLACNSGNTNSNLSVKTFDAMVGNSYYIVWDNKNSAAGFDFQLTEEEIIIPITYNTVNDPTINTTYRMCIVDMNNDDKDDVVGVSNGTLKIHYQGTGGTLTPALVPIVGTSLMPNWSMAAGDFNKDGFNDLMMGNGSGISLWMSNATGTAYTSITPGQYIFCQRTNFADLNNDGHLDAFSCHDVAPNVYYLNDGSNGLVHYQVGNTPGAMALGGITGNYASIFTDIDNDGDTDMFVSKCSGPACELHVNGGNNNFTNMAAFTGLNVTPVDSWSSAVADFDNDGDMDILIGSNGSVNSMYFRNNVNDGNAITQPFTNLSVETGWDADPTTARDYIAYDFDNDGYVDVMSSSGRIMFNVDGEYFVATQYTGLTMGAVGDLNSDGFLDILNGSNIRYAVPNGNGWLRINLKGIQSNSNGIGARVEIYGPFGKQIRDIRSGEGFGYMSTLSAHFGLGEAAEVTQAIIKWPSGVVDVINNPQANSAITVVEGSSPLSVANPSPMNFTVYPNPARDVLNIQLGEAMAAGEMVRILDLNGRQIMQTETLENIPVKTLATGLYVVTVKTTDGKEYSQKFYKN